MPETPSAFRSLFRFKTGESPREADLNAGLVDKIDTDLNSAIVAGTTNAAGLATLTARVDVHADGAGNLISSAPEFIAYVGTPTYVSATQFYVSGNHAATFTVNRAVRVTLTATTPVSTVQVVSYNGGTNRTTVTLFEAIIDVSLASLEVGLIQFALPKISVGNLDFTPVSAADLATHIASGDHDSRYIRTAAVGVQTILGPLKNFAVNPYYLLEDSSIANSLYRQFFIQLTGQVATFVGVRPDTAAQRQLLGLDFSTPEAILYARLNANGQRIIGLPAPGASSDPARLVDVPLAGTTPSTQAIGDSAAGGAAATWSKNDHKHAMPAFATPITQAFGDTPDAGAAATVAKSDHRHGMPSSGALDKVTSDVTVVSTAAETTIYTKSIVGGILGSNNILRLSLVITDYDSDAATLLLRAKYGGTTLATLTITTAGGINNMLGLLTFILQGNGATNAQQGLLKIEGDATLVAGATSVVAVGTSAVDSTSAQTLLISADFDASSAANKIVIGNAFLEVLQ